jgi:hypothetical protein
MRSRSSLKLTYFVMYAYHRLEFVRCICGAYGTDLDEVAFVSAVGVLIGQVLGEICSFTNVCPFILNRYAKIFADAF